MKHSVAHRRESSSSPSTLAVPVRETDPPSSTKTRDNHAETPAARLPWIWQTLGVIAEILITLAVICALWVVWQMWWTGVMSEHVQAQTTQSVAWSNPGAGGNVKIAQQQQSNPPVEPANPKIGDLIAQIYIPRFGDQWQRNIVEGTNLAELNLHGMGHYTQTQLPGQIGNFAVAGHRNGYGQPLGNIDKLQPGDSIVIRTKNYWYVYQFTNYTIVPPTAVTAVAANPEAPSQPPTKRMITLTTCEPKYTAATSRWISYGQLKYWAKVSDGIPKELSTTNASGSVKFINNGGNSIVSQLSSLIPVILVAAAAYLVMFIAAAIAWRWPGLKASRTTHRRKADSSIYGTLLRLQPGVFGIRLLLLALLLLIGAAALMQWAFPWMAANIPYLQAMTNYATV